MSSINSGLGQVPLTSSLAGISASGKSSSSEKSAKADGSAAKVVQSANAESSRLMGSEKSSDRDADGRQLYDSPENLHHSNKGETPADAPALTRSKDPNKARGQRLDLDA